MKKTAVVIINGISFPYALVDHALAWAKKERAQLRALFLTSGREMPEEYVFPTEIDLDKNIIDSNDSQKDGVNILRGHAKLFMDMLKAEGLSGSVEHINNASLHTVQERVKSATTLIIAPESGEITLQAITRFSLQELIDHAPVAVEVVR